MSCVKADIDSLTFKLFTDNDVRKLSVLEIVTPNSFDSLDHPIKGGLYDLTLGPSGTQMDHCITCKNGPRHCPGHFGHIELPLPVINPLFHKEIFVLLQNSCRQCCKITASFRYKLLLLYQLKLLNAGYITEAQELFSIASNEEGAPPDAANDNRVKENVMEFLENKKLCLDREVPMTKTSESLRRQFLDSYNKHIASMVLCPYCKSKQSKIVKHQKQLLLPEKVEKGPDSTSRRIQPILILPGRAKTMLREVWEKEKELIEAQFPILKYRDPEITYGTDLFFMNTILVSPPKTRPILFADGRSIEHSQSRLYQEIIKTAIIAKEVIKATSESGYDELREESKMYIQGLRGETIVEKLQYCWRELQASIDCLLSSEGKTSSSHLPGFKQLIEKKEGAMRKHIMGKRVNYAARSVITPDPNLLIHEIGVPEHFAKKLTYPVKANFFNVNELRKMVQNGPDVYPGALIVEMENGSVIRLTPGDENKARRNGIAKLLLKSVESGGGKIVHRHLLNGDVLLMNRQPTLHRPSIMAHTARILKNEKTLRLHYSNCKSYNADFDGDEMNAHFPQNEIARSEAYNLVSVRNNYLVPKDGTPLGGLIQDHVVSGVRLTIRGQFFNREDYYQLVYQGLSHIRGDIKLLPPSILKPKMLWSGKQIISTILLNIIPKNKSPIFLHSKAKIGGNSWQNCPSRPWKCGKEFKDKDEMSESSVIIHNGMLLCGVLDKQHYGATPFGLTHCLYELYGGSCSTKFLDSVGKLFMAYLQLNGFTLGIKDILINEEEDRKRDEIIEKSKKVGDIASSYALGLDYVPPDLEERLEKAYFENKDKFKARLDEEYKKILNSYTNDINTVCLPNGLISKFPKNNLQLMVTSGAKGSAVNTMQMSCLLGQIELEGKRPPLMISGKSLPCFKPFETNPSAGGYVHSRFMTGITPQDFFFHCMAGREGLIDTAVKTARSGYLQRCLIKNLEGVSVCYDGTVRDHDGSVIQYAYGEDGLEVQKSKFLTKSQMDFLYRNKKSIIDDSVLQVLKGSTDWKKIGKYKRKIKNWYIEGNDEKWRRGCSNGFSLFSAHIRDEIRAKYWRKYDRATGRCKATRKIIEKWRQLGDEEKNAYKCLRPDPVMAKFNRNTDFGVLTEKLEGLIDDYLSGKSGKVENTVRNIVNIKYMSSLSQPGEAVGLLAAQSIGEPSTQMTLNTFHFAGRGDMNVTLGIPRLREILMSAAKEIKTPYMDIPLKKTSEKKMEKRGKKLKKKFQMVKLADVLEKIEINEQLVIHPTLYFTYRIRFIFLPYNSYKSHFLTSPKEILKYMEKDFLITLCKHVRKLGKKYGDVIYESKEEKSLTKDEKTEEKEADDKSVDLEPTRERSISVSSSEGEVDEEDTKTARRRQEREEAEGERESSDSEEDEDEEEEVEDKDKEDKEKEKRREKRKENNNWEEDANEEGSELFNNEEDELVVDGNEEDEEVMDMSKLSSKERLDVAQRQNFVLKTFPLVKRYKFDVLNEEWCEILIGIPSTMSHIDFSVMIRTICENSVIYSIPCVKRSFLHKNNKRGLCLKTEGINLIEIFKHHKFLDLNRLYANDIYQMAQVYGIEAASRVIVNELKEVFGVYGITVDPRHLLLIADFMTHQGVFSPFSRTGIAVNPSPIQQMSFESTTGFLKDAVLLSKKDSLSSPSSRIATGKYCVSGTGCFDLINDCVYSLRKNQPKEIRMCSGTGFQ